MWGDHLLVALEDAVRRQVLQPDVTRLVVWLEPLRRIALEVSRVQAVLWDAVDLPRGTVYKVGTGWSQGVGGRFGMMHTSVRSSHAHAIASFL